MAFAFAPGLALAIDAGTLPTGGVVVGGLATISQSGNAMTIRQDTSRAAINWQDFSIGSGASVAFNQTSSAAVVLNRVVGQNPSQILGSLSANGQVFVVNPSGVLFGQGAQVNAQGILASTRDIAVSDFMAGQYRFEGASIGRVVNEGNLNAAVGGYVALIGAQVKNLGSIEAPQGGVRLSAADKVLVTVDNGSLAGFVVERGTLNGLVENGGLIRADGGRVYLTADALDGLSKAVVNNTGAIDARSVENRNGTIVLLADMSVGETRVAGNLDAGKGGFVETSGARVKVADGARVQAGEWLIDPHDFTIAASGGDITGATLSANLGGSSVTILSSSGSNVSGNGDINVNDAVSWSANNLTLTAARGININAVMTATGTSTLAMNTGTANGADSAVAGGTIKVGFALGGGFAGRVDFDRSGIGLLSINGQGYTLVGTLAELQAMNSGLAGQYALSTNIDASPTSTWNAGAGFVPVGNATTPFTGVLNGLGHTVSGLAINRPAEDNVGLFGYINGSGSAVRNVGVVGGSVVGRVNVGGLAGTNAVGTVENAYASASVKPTTLPGNNAPYSVQTHAGGLVGDNSGTVRRSYSSADVNVVSTDVSAEMNGGLVGRNFGGGTISESYAEGAVKGNWSIGGLVGYNEGGSRIAQCYATGAVTAFGGNAGGLVGSNVTSGVVEYSYATGAVWPSMNAGGLVGANFGASSSVTNSYWNTVTTGRAQACGFNNGTCTATGKTTVGMTALSTYSGWSIDDVGGSGNIWRIYDGFSNPLLRTFLTPISTLSASKTYDGQAYTVSLNGMVWYLRGGTVTPDTNYLLGTPGQGSAQGAVNAGSYSLTSGLYSTSNLGYDIDGGTLTVARRPVNLSGSRVYDGTLGVDAGIFSLGNLVAGESLTLIGVGTLANKNVANGKPVSVGSLALGDGVGGFASNYTLIGGTLTADITPRTLNVSFNKTYDGTVNAAVTGDDRIAGDSLGFGGSATFLDKNAGNGKTVNFTGLSLSGTDAGNYVFAATSGSQTADIAPRTLNVAYTGVNKTYDGTTAATVTSSDNRVSGDALIIGESAAAFADKNAGSGKTINVSGISLSGADAGNYVLASTTASTTADIARRALTVAYTGVNKTYDGTTAATVTTSDNRLSGDVLSINETAVFSDKNAGLGKAINISGVSLSGADAGNYVLDSSTGSASADIARRPLTVAYTGVNKTYDGTTAATVTTTDNRVSGDALSIVETATFADRNAANGKTITIGGASLSGADAGNYVLVSTTGSATADIVPRILNVTYTGVDKPADGTTKATVATQDDRVAGDTLTVGTTAAFVDGNVDTAKPIVVTGVTLSGADAGNYRLASTSGSATANIVASDSNSLVVALVPNAPATGYSASIASSHSGAGNVSNSGSGSASNMNIESFNQVSGPSGDFGGNVGGYATGDTGGRTGGDAGGNTRDDGGDGGGGGARSHGARDDNMNLRFLAGVRIVNSGVRLPAGVEVKE